ncbi:MAG: Uma2 family endonuclease [Chloroherpetonaceae bacterium]|nr:Uma2 family endonuclease [Chloroherpetonaceae bacterium]
MHNDGDDAMLDVSAYLSKITLSLPKTMEMSDEDFYEFAKANPTLKMERDKHRHIILMALTGGNTGRRNSEIVAELTLWNRTHKLGVVFDSSTGFRLPNGAIRSPDAAFVRLERWNALSDKQKETFPPLAPDFVVELMSNSDDLADANEKMHEYLEHGTLLGWLIFPQAEEVRLYQPNLPPQLIKGFDQVLRADPTLPNFSLDLRLLR